jgi:hypothetical protein
MRKPNQQRQKDRNSTCSTNELPTFDDLVARLRHAPETGHIWLDEKRVFLLHSAAYGALRRELIENLGSEIARGLLTRMGHLAGSRDAELAKKIRKTANITDVFSIGPQLHALEGIVQTETIALEVNIAKGHFFGDFIWRHSVEDDAHIADYGIGTQPDAGRLRMRLYERIHGVADPVS